MTTETKHWRYSVPNRKGYEGWAILFLDSAGCFAALSDYGDWSYRWNARGFSPDEDIRKFLLRCDDDYLLRKIAPKQEYDSEATQTSIRELILGMRREKQLDKEEARYEWDLSSDVSTEFDFGRWMQNTDLPEAHEVYCQKYSEQAKAFLRECMPRLKEAIKNDLGL